MTSHRLLSFGRHPPFPQVPQPCHWRDALPDLLAEARRVHGTTLPYGNGLSYGDSCLAVTDSVLHLRPLDRFIAADWTTGLIVAEAGVSLEEVLYLAIPRGWFLPVTPGTKYVTLGGAIANDVHGKNHHLRGSFGRHVTQFGLVRSDVGRIICSPDSEMELFAATIGGLGLTGVIEWAEIRLRPINSSRIDSLTQRFFSLDEFFDLSDELDERHEYCVSWIDGAARGRHIGRGVYMCGDFASHGELAVEASRTLQMSFTPPVSIVNGMTLKAFNKLYWHKAPRSRRCHNGGYEPFFYPLDGVRQWNRIYGPRGFQQYQCLIPPADARPAIHALLTAIAASGTGSFLAVLKRCGTVCSPGLLSFPQPGTTLALDFPQNDQLERTLFVTLDAIVREVGGRLYPAKDAHMKGEDFRRSYPAWHKVEALRDPALNSRFWQRVTK